MRYLMTHSLLSSWLYLMRENPYSDATTETDPMEDFMKVLRREPTETTEAMQRGIDFEDLVTGILTGAQNAVYHVKAKDETVITKKYATAEHPWYEAARQVSDRVRGGLLQYRAKMPVTVRGVDLLLYGRLDALKAGTIFDIKFSGSYERGKFFPSTQHPVYMQLIPEAERFVYLISNGTDVWTETYEREDVPDIEPIIADFLTWLDENSLAEIYRKIWRAA